MNLTLTPDQIDSFTPLPGTCLIEVSPIDQDYLSDSGLVAIPKGIAHAQEEAKPIRKGRLIIINRGLGRVMRSTGIAHGVLVHPSRVSADPDKQFPPDDANKELYVGRIVHYYGHLHESGDNYVVAKIPQIVAVE